MIPADKVYSEAAVFLIPALVILKKREEFPVYIKV